jgi:hypothetical protein
MEIIIDFDGTCVTHEFPKVGKDIGATVVLKKLVDAGHKLILFTMRANVNDVFSPEFEGKFTGNYLDDAVDWFKQNDIHLYGIQTNPTQHTWTSSPKAYGQLFIDDCGMGCPLIYPKEGRPYVDWNCVEKILVEKGLL